jgi:3-oxoacyl-(acyl-carrier-protein) synthase
VEFADQQLRKLHVNGPRELSPFQATAWFPAATQGQISIRHGLRGESKTVMCDKASGLVSVGYAAQVISNGRCDVMLAGGTEALITPFAYAACQTEGILAKPNNYAASEVYRPFDSDRTGVVPAEGSAMILLESLESAHRRGAKIYAEIIGFEVATHSPYPGHELGPHWGMAAAMRRISMDSSRDSEPIDIIFADAIGTLEGDRAESAAIVEVFGKQSTDVMVVAPKSMTGHMYGASGAMDTAWAAMTLAEQIVPPTVNITRQDPKCQITLTNVEVRPRALRRALINGRGHGGVGAAMALRVWNR